MQCIRYVCMYCYALYTGYKGYQHVLRVCSANTNVLTQQRCCVHTLCTVQLLLVSNA